MRTPLLESGPSEASEAVVFVHGNPGSSRDWLGLLERAGSFARALALDQPGFGKADKPEDFPHTVDGHAEHLGRQLDRLGVRKAHLVLHDFGGLWGLAWAARNPEAFASVTLINIGILPGYCWHYLARIWRTPLLGELFMATATRTGFRLSLRHGNPRGLPRSFVDRMYDDFDRRTRRAILRLYRNTPDMEWMGRVSETLRPLNRPALVLWGEHDVYLPVEFAERQRETFPDADVRILEGSGHWPFIDDPHTVAEAIESFLRRVVRQPPG